MSSGMKPNFSADALLLCLRCGYPLRPSRDGDVCDRCGWILSCCEGERAEPFRNQDKSYTPHDAAEREFMKIQDMMTKSVATCSPNDNAASAALKMWNGDCGVIPVVNDDRSLAGVITDRDICMATATKDRKPSEITVSEVMNKNVFYCKNDDDPGKALQTMSEHQVRRVPVVDSGNKLVGIVSLNDLDLAAKSEKGRRSGEEKSFLSYEAVMHAHKAVCQHRPAQQAVA